MPTDGMAMSAVAGRPGPLRRLPLPGALAGLALLALSTRWYPGGYRWTRDTISALFAPAGPNGGDNPARTLAIAGAVVLAASMALLFQLLSQTARSRVHRKTIQIGGIGAMVYAALTVTPMHDLMVGIALVFFLAMMLAVVDMLRSQGRVGLLWLGVLCLAIKLGSAVVYYGDVLPWVLPPAQKVSLVLTLAWLFAAWRRNDEPRHSNA